jgi:predicted trehalose synthase
LHAKSLVEFFTLEKAIYEVSYELANRPAWVAIPINGILRVVEKVTGTKTTRDEHAASP